MKPVVNVPWWALPFVALIWMCSAVVQVVIITFVFTAKVSVLVLREIGRTLAKGSPGPR
jgi:hypothetical protein